MNFLTVMPDLPKRSHGHPSRADLMLQMLRAKSAELLRQACNEEAASNGGPFFDEIQIRRHNGLAAPND